MDVFESKTYQCAKCYTLFDGIINSTTNIITFTHSNYMNECPDQGKIFTEKIEVKHHIGLKLA